VALDSLADRRVSGVLEIEGDPAGTIYLDQGQITFARASWIPDLGARLAAVLRHMATSTDLLSGPDRPDRDIGSALVQRNYLSRGELQAILRSVIVDAAIVLTVRGGDDAFVSDIRFAAPGAHWAGAFASLRVDTVRSEALQRAEHMARYHLNRTTEVRLADLARPSAVLSRRQWAIASAVDGSASVQDLAWQCGMALYDTIECVGHLIRAGLCVPCGSRPSGMVRPRQPESRPEPVSPAAPPSLEPTPIMAPAGMAPALMAPPTPSPAPAVMASPHMPGPQIIAGSRRADADMTLPHRRPGPIILQARPVMSAPVDMAAMMPPDAGDYAPAAPDLLRRVLEGLRRIS
jgi:hypothetical protein